MGQEREGLLDNTKLIQDGRELSEEAIISLKKLEYDYLIARVGLQGTLWGTWAALAALVIIVLSPMFTTRNVVSGSGLVVIVVVMVVAIVAYGAFIFDRALSVTAS